MSCLAKNGVYGVKFVRDNQADTLARAKNRECVTHIGVFLSSDSTSCTPKKVLSSQNNLGSFYKVVSTTQGQPCKLYKRHSSCTVR